MWLSLWLYEIWNTLLVEGEAFEETEDIITTYQKEDKFQNLDK